jgi:hypothetical protein
MDIEEKWKHITSTSNTYYHEDKFTEALGGYQKAHLYAKSLNDKYRDCQEQEIPYYHIFIISCHNLSNVYQELNDHKQSEKMLLRNIYYVFYLVDEGRENNLLLNSIMSKVVFAYQEFLDFTKQNQEELKSILVKIQSYESFDVLIC